MVLVWLRIVAWFSGTLLVNAALLCAVFAAGLVYEEMRGSEWQAHYLARLARQLYFQVEPGANAALLFPRSGPYDYRYGYVQLADFSRELSGDYAIVRQARVSPRMAELQRQGLYAPYQEKTQAGLRLLDCRGRTMYSATYPERVWRSFDNVPPLLVDSLLFIENREILDPEHPKKNPAIEWDRLGKAMIDQAAHLVDPATETPGGSTLATQIEKYRHSPEGRTSTIHEKFRQMASASIKAYLPGEETIESRRGLVLEYLNTVPLSARAGYGEVNGIGDGMWAWYGRDFGDVDALLRGRGADAGSLARRAGIYKEALSLMISQRRPSYYLGGNTVELDQLTNSYLRLLASAGVITESLRDAALSVRLQLRDFDPEATQLSYTDRKAVNAVRTSLAATLHTPRLYDLDRMDLTAQSTLAPSVQAEVTQFLRDLRSPDKATAAGLTGEQLLEDSDPSKVIYSFTIFERGADANYLRVQTDNLDQPFDINAGAKLDLGSTAKFRTLVTYLEIVAELHARYRNTESSELRKVSVDGPDVLTRWAVEWLSLSPDRSLAATLEAAMDRTYSANPGEKFFTGGGLHTFENFHAEDDHRVYTVRDGFHNSVNLVFIRLMRDVVHHYMYQTPGSTARLLADASDPRRKDYLARFADREGRVFIGQFLQKYKGRTAEEIEERVVSALHRTPAKLAAAFRTLEPDAPAPKLRAFLEKWLDGDSVSDDQLDKLYDTYAPDKMSLADRGYVAGVHPLELWVARYLRRNPKATHDQAIEASALERQEVYGWLFKTHHKNAQDIRILGLLETEGFNEIHRHWKRLGFPFDSLVPSYATALGSSADRPAALAELMGIVVNGGLRLPTARLEHLHFAEGTPYDTEFERRTGKPERLLPAEVAKVLRDALVGVVADGTAKRVKDAFVMPDGSVLEVGGKTGTGDHRFDVYGPHGQLISSRAVNRTGTFVFLIGDRFFGTVTAHVHGPDADNYRFTSALSVQLLKDLAPILMPLHNVCSEDGARPGTLPVHDAPPSPTPLPGKPILSQAVAPTSRHGAEPRRD
jgi:membrane peptidoglycan carboxypeptidase